GIPAAASGQIGSVRRPALGCVVSKLRESNGHIPPYVSTSDHRLLRSYDDPEEPAYLGPAHRPFRAIGPISENVGLKPGIPPARFADRRQLLRAFDRLPEALEVEGAFEGHDRFSARALEMITSTRVRDALDIDREPARLRERYGPAGQDFL